MCFQKDLFLDLPYEIRRLIVTQYLTGGALSNSLRVSKAWYAFFKYEVWEDKTIGPAIRSTLEKNWQSRVFREKEEYWRLPEECEIGAVSQSYLALVSPESTPLECVNIRVFKLATSELWTVPGVFDTVLVMAKRNHYEMVMSDNILAVRVELREIRRLPEAQQLLVWNMWTGEKIVDQKIDEFQTFDISPNEDDKNLLILHTNYVEVWDFSNPKQITKVQTTALSPRPFSTGYYMSPYVTQSSVDPTSGNRSIHVWKFSKSPFILQTHVVIENLSTFVHENGKRQNIHIDEVAYFGGYFIISARCPLRAGDEDIEVFSLKLLSDNGNILRECFLPQCRVDPYVNFYPFSGRLTVVIDAEVYLFRESLKDMKGSMDEQLCLNKMPALDGRNSLFFQNTSCHSAHTLCFDDGVVLLNIQSLDFWQDVDFKFVPECDMHPEV